MAFRLRGLRSGYDGISVSYGLEEAVCSDVFPGSAIMMNGSETV